MLGGGTDDSGTTFGWRAATIPARRGLEAVERLVALYQSQRSEDEAPLTFFRRVSPAIVKSSLADLEQLTPDTAPPETFIDLAEDRAFQPEIMDGECSA
jgi:hypothetical protein